MAAWNKSRPPSLWGGESSIKSYLPCCTVQPSQTLNPPAVGRPSCSSRRGSLSNTGKARLASTPSWFIFGTFIKVPNCWRFWGPLSIVSLSRRLFGGKNYKHFKADHQTGACPFSSLNKDFNSDFAPKRKSCELSLALTFFPTIFPGMNGGALELLKRSCWERCEGVCVLSLFVGVFKKTSKT